MKYTEVSEQYFDSILKLVNNFIVDEQLSSSERVLYFIEQNSYPSYPFGYVQEKVINNEFRREFYLIEDKLNKVH